MKNLYAELFKEFSEDNELASMAHFVAIKGRRYEKSDVRLMIIGRAPNGWSQFPDYSDKNRFGEIAEKQFLATDRMTHSNGDLSQDNGWLDNRNGKLYSSHCPTYCVSNKAFWSYSKMIFESLTGTQDKSEIWTEHIAWSNLYKLSPVNGGNPSKGTKQRQMDICIEILKKELDTLKPTHILFITGYEWFTPFEKIFVKVTECKDKKINRGNNINSVFVEGTASYGSAKVVIACRPEYRKKNDYVQEVINFLK